MASSAFSPVSRSRRNQVFVSFRGEDTRNNFTSHLVAALRRRAIDTYIDNKLEKGGEISPTLMEAIETSQISIVVLSKNYASSSWCLNELSRIIDCKQRNNQIIVPIFYHVDPSDVRNQRGTFAEAFVEHAKKRAGHEVETWKAALREVANLSGCHVKIERCESELIEEIVTDISTKLSCTSSSNFQDLVGIYSRIEQLKSQLHFEFKEVVTVGIWGMGGIGKTTIAEAVFHQISAQFEGCCFLTNVREESERHGLNFLRNKLISSILEDKNLDVGTMLLPPIIHDRLQFKKVLIILDDVNDSTQLEILPPRHCFGHGSRIILTSRDRQVLQQVFDPRYDQIYEVQGLTDGEALELFSLFAFKQSYPKEDYMGLSHKLVEYAKGVPLALKVLGSALKEKSSRVWESALHKLKETPNPKIDNVLRISYDELDDKEKDIFLDIACFFRGVHIDCVTEILEGFNFSAVAGIDVLIDKSLIARRNSMLEMHDLLHEMGQNIVRKSSKEPGKRSRLWKPEDIYNVLKNNTGTEAVEAMFLDMSTIRELHISPTAFARMQNLRMLKFYSTYPKDRKLHVTGSDLLSLSDRLSYLRWDGYPFKSLPLTFCAENLVYLYMPHSNVKKLWNRPQNLVNLKWLSLYGSKHLVEIPDLSRAINLKTVDLSHCSSLVDISSIQYAYKLSFLYLEYCKSLGHLPNCTGLTSLKFLNLHNCSKITNFPEISSSIEHLGLSGTGIQKVSSSVEGFRRLKHMDLCYCKRLQSLPSGLCKLEAFARLNLSSFSILESCLQISGSVERLEISGLDGITRGLMLSSTKPLRINVLLTGTKSSKLHEQDEIS